MTKSGSLRADFEKAITRLEEALALPKDAIVRDSAIQRFEISFELCWKFLKAYLEEEHNASCTSPRICYRAAFRHWSRAPLSLRCTTRSSRDSSHRSSAEPRSRTPPEIAGA